MRSAVRLTTGALALAGLTLASGCEWSVEVDTVAARIGTIRQSFTEPATTRLQNTYPIAMPVTARIGRIELEPGDRVEKGQPLVAADLEPFELAVEEAEAAIVVLEAQVALKKVDGSEDAFEAVHKQVEASGKQAERAALELKRIKEVYDDGGVSRTELDDAQLRADASEIEFLRQQFTERVFRTRQHLQTQVVIQQLAQAKLRLANARRDLRLAKGVTAPITGVVLARYEQGDTIAPAGTRLLLLGDLSELEAEAEVLSQDALAIQPGSEVSLDPGSARPAILGEVKRIEPAGFTKLSSLGVEQQRVRVIVSLAEVPEGLGVGYRLQARFFTGTREGALVVPRFSVLQAPDRTYYVLGVEDGALVRRPVRIGLRSDLELEVLEGIAAGTRIVKTPDARMDEGQRVKVRGGD